LLPRYRKDNLEYLLTGSQMVSVVLYVLCQLGFAIAAIYYISISPFLALVISLAIIAVFVLFIFSAGIGRQHAKAVSGNISEKTSRMKAIKEHAKGMDESVVDPEVKKQIRRLVEEIRYSDPVSRQDLDDVESELERAVNDIKKMLSSGDTVAILGAVENAKRILQKRNDMCKDGK
jgi:molybdopterin converting factor small subunit